MYVGTSLRVQETLEKEITILQREDVKCGGLDIGRYSIICRKTGNSPKTKGNFVVTDIL